MRAVIALFFSVIALTDPRLAEAAQRVALVVGNGAYTGTAALANPTKDATAIAATLETLGFEVILATDVDRRGAIAAIDKFTAALNGAEVGLFFFAGHGIQIGGQNFLLPTDVSVESERALRYSAIDIQEVIAEMERRADASIAILDACRDNPFVDALTRGVGASRSTTVSRGLGMLRLTGRGAIIAYAAASGDVAADGEGGHSPFTAALLEEIDEPRVEVGLVFRHVARRVIDETKGRQRPELLVRLVDEVYLNPGEPSATAPDTPAKPPLGLVEPTQPVVDKPATVEPPLQPVVDNPATVEPDPRAVGGEMVYGTRVLHPPSWLAGLTLPEPITWRSAAATPVAEAANDSYAGAQPLPLAAAVEAQILPRGDADWYVVDVPAAGELRVDVEATPPELDFHARVWNADHQVVADWQGAPGPGGGLAGRFPLPRAGKYWIEAVDGSSDAESAQPFKLAIDFAIAPDSFEPNDSPGAAVPLPSTATVTPVIYPRTDADWYKVWAPAPGLLTVTATGVPPALDIAVRVWDSSGRVVRDWVVPPRLGGDTVLEAELAEPGVYLIETADSSSDAAAVEPFELKVAFAPVPDELEPDNSFGQAALTPSETLRKVAIFPRGDADWLALDVAHPGELRIAATGLPANLDVYIRVWTADKAVLRDWFGPARAGGDVEGFADLPTPGRYFIEMTDGSNDQASPDLFELALAFTPEPDQYEPNNTSGEASALTPGGTILFNILPRGDNDWFRVDAPAAGELAVVIDESPENLDLYFRVWDQDRNVIRDWVAPYRKGGVAEGFADLPKAGVYFIEVADGSNDERSVQHATLSTVFTPAADMLDGNNSYGRAAPLAFDAPLKANILPRGDADWYLVEAPGAGAFKVVVDEVDPGLDIYVRLWDAEARAGDWHGPPRPGGVTEAEISVPAAGTYRLEVTDGSNDARSKNPYRIAVGFH